MLPHKGRTKLQSVRKAGFALIASISIMAVLLLITIALFSLASVANRSATFTAAQTEAQANAKAALMMAIGELQESMGPDQRISANAAILDQAPETSVIDGITHPHWLGVWDSWVAGDPAVAPVNPDYPSALSQHQTIGDPTDPNLKNGMQPLYDQKSDHFRRWLVSLNPEDATADPENPNLPLSGVLSFLGDPAPKKDSSAVRLVGAASLGLDPSDSTNDSNPDYINAQLVGIDSESKSTSGRFAWWVGDQSQKATLMADSYDIETNPSDAERIYRSQAPGSMGTKKISELSQITASEEIQFDKVGDFLDQLDLINVNGSQVSGSPSNTYTFVGDNAEKFSFHDITLRSYGVLTDVREGGLKRDLSTILERPINLEANDEYFRDNHDEFMLYAFDDPRFTDRSNSRVPIQDLSAYYQLYDNEPSFANQRREGVRYNSSELRNSIQMVVPDFDGDEKDRQRILREYTALYRQPVITKVQFLVAVAAQPVTAEERQYIIDRINDPNTGDRNRNNLEPVRDSDTYKLRMGIIPMVTLWNPNNVSLVMDSSQIMRFSTPPFGFRFRKFRSQGSPDEYDYNWTNLSYNSGDNFGGATTGQASGNSLLRLRFGANTSSNIVFEPGEVKVFSLPESTGSNLLDGGDAISLISTDRNFDVANGWDPFGFFMIPNSTPHGAYEDESPEAYGFRNVQHPGQSMVFNPADSITFSIDAESPEAVASGSWRDGRYVSQARSSDPKGSGFTLYFMDEDWQANWRDNLDHIRHYTMVSRHGSSTRDIQTAVATFNKELITPGFPGEEVPIDFEDQSNAIPCQQIINASSEGEVITLFEFSLTLGCEAGTSATGGFGGGRRIASRPFLHSPSSAPPFIDQSDKASLYNYGWDWMVGKVNTVEDSILRAKPGTGNGYYGGGYTVESGTTNVIQREIPVLPPISIASLSHAHLGGFSLAYAMSIGDNPDTDIYFKRAGGLQNPVGLEYQRTTAAGQAGLAPHVVQSIGNSYAHPNLPAASAFTTKTRHFDSDEGPVSNIPFVDHSYLANKALWDEFFFSSIAPQPSKVPLYGSSNLSAKQVAEDFFSGVVDQLVDQNGDNRPTPLPNRRISPYLGDLDQTKFNELFDEADDNGNGSPNMYDIFSDGLADKIAAHLMVDGTFNINSTSVDAWSIFLSSLKGKPVAYLNGGISPSMASTQGTPLGTGILPNAAPIKSADIARPNSPPEQWKTGRELTDDEIDQLAQAIVKQVKLRGPFLSLSEFVNRRLDQNDTELSLKGALQAALDDTSVSINANFREPGRILDDETSGISGFEFKEAATGPTAYGSTAYVDQADILRHFSEQLTPRGDTFVIRSYGDSLDAGGNVIARAWCEAIVQRVPEYSDPANQPHEKGADLTETNKFFGREFEIVSFRWLSSDEV